MLKSIVKIALAFLACVSLGYVARHFTRHGQAAGNLVPMTKEQQALFVSRFHVKPNTIMIVEVMDFECPPCQQTFPILRSWLKLHPDVSFQPVHFPIDFHKNAMNAAIAAEMTRPQGKFEDTFVNFYMGETKLDPGSLAAYLNELDPALGSNSVAREQAKARVTGDMDFVKQMKIAGTPTILGWDGKNLYIVNSQVGLNLLVN